MTPPPAAPGTNTARPMLVAVLLAGFFAAIAIPLIALNWNGTNSRAVFDQNTFHLPVVRQFSEEWPRPDFYNYESATTPGYHVFLALVDRYVSDDVRVLRAVGLLFTLALLALVGHMAGRWVRPGVALAMCLPMIASLYIFSSGVWLLPDNIGWLGVVAILLLVLQPRVRETHLAWGGAILIALVFVRQAHIWAASLLWLGAWLSGSTGASGVLLPRERKEWVERSKRLILAFCLTLPAFVLLAWFVRLWGGLTPPLFRSDFQYVQGPNWAMPTIILASIGVGGVCYGGFLAPSVWRALRASRGAMATALLGTTAGALLCAIPETSWSLAEHRTGGLWNAALHAPVIAERSTIMIALAGLGGFVVACLSLVLGARDRWVFLGCLGASAAALTMNAYAYPRYCEGLILVLLGYFSAQVASRATPEPAARGDNVMPLIRALAPAGPILLALLLAYVTYTRSTSGPAQTNPDNPLPLERASELKDLHAPDRSRPQSPGVQPD